MRKGNALLQQLGFHFFHVKRIVVYLDRVAVETQLVLFLINSDELVLDDRHCQQRVIDIVFLRLNEVDGFLFPVAALSNRDSQSTQLHMLQFKRLGEFFLRDPVASFARHIFVDFLKDVTDVHQLQ